MHMYVMFLILSHILDECKLAIYMEMLYIHTYIIILYTYIIAVQMKFDDACVLTVHDYFRLLLCSADMEL